jgi:hypothetical protein
MVDSSALLQQLGIKHALVGGLAVGAHGHPRATRYVDFLVDDSAWLKTGTGLVVVRSGLPVEAHGVPIDTISVRDDEKHLFSAIEAAEVSEGVPVAPVEALVFTKLSSPRSKDLQDVVELIAAGLDVERVRAYLDRYAPSFRDRFEQAVVTAAADEQ